MKFNRNRQGMTLVEMLIALGISVVIIGGLAASVYTIMNVTGRGNAEITALRDVQSVSYWINNDAQMARDVTLIGGDPGNGMILDWDDSLGNPQSSNYTLSGSELLRNYNGISSAIAWNVSSVEFTVTNGVLTYSFVSTPQGRWDISRQVTGQVYLRAWMGP